jgi:hypothetical protein
MTILPTLVNPVPLPAPVTSGSGTQTYTDPIGDVWVAANGVNGGAWKRARDVLFCEYYRSAAFAFTAGAWINFGYDTQVRDAYGMYIGSGAGAGTFTPPIPGVWRMTQGIAGAATATGQYVQVGLWDSAAGTIYRNAQGFASAAIQTTAELVYEHYWSGTPSAFLTRIASSTALTGANNANTAFFTATYVGTG